MKKQLSRKTVFLISYLAYSAVYIARLNLTVASPVMQEQGLMSAADIGIMGGLFFLLYSAGQLFNGYFGDIFPPKIMVMTGLFLTAASNLGIWLMPDPSIIIALWGVNGFAQSMLWGPLLRSIGAYFPPKKKTFFASALVSSVGVGSVLGVFIATAAIRFGDVRSAFLWPGFLALAAFLAAAVFFPYSGQKTDGTLQKGNARKHGSVPKHNSVPRHSGVLKKIVTPWFCLLLMAAMFHGILKDNINLWMASYFMDSYAIDLVTMSFYVFAVPLLSLAGRLIYPFCYRLLGKKEHTVSIAALSTTILSLLPLCFQGVNAAVAAISLSVAAAAISVVNTSFLTIYPMHYEKDGCVSRIVGVMDFATYMGAGLSSSFYGGWLENHSYSGMFMTWIAFAAAAIVILYAVQKKENNYERKSNSDFH